MVSTNGRMVCCCTVSLFASCKWPARGLVASHTTHKLTELATRTGKMRNVRDLCDRAHILETFVAANADDGA